MNKNFFIFGYGYTARHLQDELTSRGFRVIGTKRAASECSNSQQLLLIDFNDHDAVNKHLLQATHVLVSTPPSAEGDPTLSTYLNSLNLAKEKLEWIGYLSSTGVYGDHQGAWVDETSATNAVTAHARLRLHAENEWLKLALQKFPVHIFRLAGIYGPKRNRITEILHGKQYSINSDHCFSRVHVNDITQAILKSIDNPTPGEIYNVADDLPSPSHVVDAYVAKLLHRENLPLISLAEAPLSQLAKEFYAAHRKVSNAKLKRRLNFDFTFPTFQDGLLAIFNQHQY